MSSLDRKNVANNFIITTDRLIIRPYKEDDLNEAFELMQDKDLFRYLKMNVMTMEEYKKLFNWLIKSYEKGLDEDFKYSFSINLKDNGRHIGWCGVGWLDFNHDYKEIYYLIGKNYWGKGYASEAVSALIDYCFNVMELEQLVAKVDPDNIASKRIIEKSGFKFQYMISNVPEQFNHCNGELLHKLTKEEYLNRKQLN